MPKGSCSCGDWTYEYDGEPAAVVVCHCLPCRKTAGSNGSYNHLLPEKQFKKLSGEDLLFSRKGDSGKDVKYRNCAKCATVMVANAEAMDGLIIVKAGTLDDDGATQAPAQEIYRKNAPGWSAPISVAEQKNGAE